MNCGQMERKMGLSTRRDQDEMKGCGVNPVNSSHRGCMEILNWAR